jgi:hypothetical protein
MKTSPTAHEVMEFRAATGCGVNQSKELLQTWDRSLIDKVIEAARLGGRLPTLESFGDAGPEVQMKMLAAANAPSEYRHLVDPIESDPVQGPIVKSIINEEENRIRTDVGGEWQLGSCHLIWRRTKERLAAEHGINWHSPAELNPSSVFD